MIRNSYLVFPIILNLFVLSSVQARSISIGDDRERMLSLGNGWKSEAERRAGSCAEPGATAEDGQVGRIDLTLDTNEGSTSEKLGLDIGGRARIGVLSYSLSAQYNHEAMSRGFSIAYNYNAKLSRSRRIENKSGSPVKSRPGFERALKDGAAWKDLCGDEVVYMVDEGAMLLVNIRMDFTSREEMMKFKSHVGVSGPLFDAHLGVDLSKGEFNRNSKMTVNLLQIGGDPAKLGQVFCPKEVDENGKMKDPNCMEKAAHVVSCNFGDIKSCMETIRLAVAYGNGQSPEQFGGQISNFEKYVTQKLYTESWRELGGDIFPRIPSSEATRDAKGNREKLSQIFEENYQNWIYSNRLVHEKGPRLSHRQKGQMMALEVGFKKNMTVVAEAIEKCYDLPLHCKEALAGTLTELGITDGSGRYADQASIERLIVPETYAQLCDQGLVATSLDPLRKTISALNEVAFGSRVHGETGAELEQIRKKWLDEDVCAQAGKVLEGMQSLQVKDSQISDLRPLAMLPQLEEVDLSNNKIGDLRSLTTLHRLRKLVLDANLIHDVSQLPSMASLRELSLQKNPLENVHVLGHMNQLTFLDLSQNERNVVCPLPETVCQTSALSNLTSFQLVRNHLDGRVGAQAIQLNDGRVVFNGGMSEQGEPTSFNYIFTPGFWETPVTKAVPSSIGRIYHTLTKLLDGRILIFGGWIASKTALDSWELYSPSFQFLRGGRMATQRAGHTATLLPNGKVLLVGGWSGEDPSAGLQVASSFEIFNPTKLESEGVGELRSPRVYHTATLMAGGGDVLLVGGYSPEASSRSAEVLDVVKLKTRLVKKAWLKDGRGMHTATLLQDGRVLIAGGFSKNSEAVSSLEIYDPASQTFTEGPKMKLSRGSHVAQLLENGKVFLAGGRQRLNLNYWAESEKCLVRGMGESNPLSTQMNDCLRLAEIFDPVASRVLQIGDMTYPRAHPAIVPLADYRFLLIGGVGTEFSPNTSEIFDYSALIEQMALAK